VSGGRWNLFSIPSRKGIGCGWAALGTLRSLIGINDCARRLLTVGQHRFIMKPRMLIFWLFCFLIHQGLLTAYEAQAAPQLLWQIGKPDRDNREFALAPRNFQKFSEDGLFVVGRSESQRDWPYVQPGPHDAWAGSRQHTFTVLFAVKGVSKNENCKLLVHLIDTQHAAPPRLRISVNGHAFEKALTAGAGDESVQGNARAGKPVEFELPISTALLREGANELTLTTLAGSWLLYDWIGFEAPASLELGSVEKTVLSSVTSPGVLAERKNRLMQIVRLTVRNFGEPAAAVVHVEGAAPVNVSLDQPRQTVEVAVPPVAKETPLRILLEVRGKKVAEETVILKPVRQLTVYILPHSHTDIGYTESQYQVEEKQVQNLIKGLEYAKRTAQYPSGAQFKWNVEVLWAADCYLRRASASQRAEFIDAVKKGWVGLNGMYLNELTGLCGPEELLRLFRYGTELSEQTGVKIDSAMISDVPGYTWATVTAMSQAGIRYFSTAPNYFDRIGDILVQWENKPFYWMSPSGREKVLVWIPYKGYAMSHLVKKLTPDFVQEYQAALEQTKYPYDIAYMRWSGHGDNAEPDPAISEFVKEWTTQYAWPRFVIATTSEAFRAFEQRYGAKLPQVRGDWTPYWEDGAGSSAAETGLNRATSDRLVQAEALCAMFAPKSYPAPGFADAWKNTLLYSEHTWGAWCSVADAENAMTKEQWEIKRSYAVRADVQSRGLMQRALAVYSPPNAANRSEAVDVFNTTSWPRTEIVFVSKELSMAGDMALDDSGQAVPSQRLRSGELAVVARDVPAFGARRFTIRAGTTQTTGLLKANGNTLENGLLKIVVDAKCGGISQLAVRDCAENFASMKSGECLNEYLYLRGDKLSDIQRSGPVRIRVNENGPVIASLLIESEAPGCNRLTREIRLAAGFDYAELINTVDKSRAPANPKPGDWAFAQKGGKESIHFAFPFDVPEGQVRLDIPFGLIRPETDQMPSACKNWFTVGRWADVSNRECGITWVSLDAPLVEVGAVTATLLGSQNNPAIWRKQVGATQTLYSWAMNNHWGTNYRAYQEGPVRFRFVLRAHHAFDPAEAARFATGFSQPLIACRAPGAQAAPGPLLRVEPAGVLVSSLKPSDDGKAYIVRLFGASGKTERANLKWTGAAPRKISLSDLSEKSAAQVRGEIEVPAYGLVTLRAEL